MICIKLTGGLGNQLFQYAFSIALSVKFQTNLCFDLSFYDDQIARHDYTPRKIALDIFGLNLPKISESTLSKFNRVIKPITYTDKIYTLFSRRRYYLEPGPHYDENVDKIIDNTYCEGYFQDERYFHNVSDKIRSAFIIKNNIIEFNSGILKLTKEITSSESVCIHIRRGDYITNPINTQIFGTLSKEYYFKAINHIEKTINQKTKKFLFSNDPEWCRETFAGYSDITIVDENHSGPNGTSHFLLMTQCKHFVIANSSFSWWAAWLASHPDKIICRPYPWFNNKEFQSASICPDSWPRINRD